MPKITEGNRLWFYQLFREKIGLGRQASVAQVEEVLAAEGVEPADVECADVAQLLEALGDLVKLTVFKKGRIYATPQPNEAYDAILERLASPVEETSGKAGAGKASNKPWKRKKGTKDPKPAKPRKRVVKVAEPEPEPEPSPEPTPEPQPEPISEPQPEVARETTPVAEAPIETETAPSPESIAATETPDEVPAAPADVEEPAQPEPFPAPVTSTPPISLTITYDPADDEPAPTEPEPGPAPAPAAPSRPAQPDFPQSISDEVLCGGAQLRALYALLPVDVDPMLVLDEDWRFARSTGAVSGNRGKAVFPLRFVHEDGTPVEVTLKRAAKQTGGKRWTLAYIDGDDGTGDTHAAVGIEGLPVAHEGAWRELSGYRRTPSEVSPDRELASFAMIGSWDSLLGTLATAAEPERWNYAHEGVGRTSRYGILREYLSVTFHRIQAEGKLGVAADGSLAAFDTGLLTPFSEPVFACFEPNRGDIAWKLAGFAVAGSGELGMRLVAEFDPLPEPARYLTQLSDLIPEQGRMVILDTESLLSRQLGRLPRAFVAEQLEGNTNASELFAQLVGSADGTGLDKGGLAELARAIKADPGTYRRMAHALEDAVALAIRRSRTSFRLCAPAYDPADDKTKLLVPLCLVDDSRVDCAMVLALQPSGAYQGAAVLPLDKAYACARVVCSEMPGWLEAERALG